MTSPYPVYKHDVSSYLSCKPATPISREVFQALSFALYTVNQACSKDIFSESKYSSSIAWIVSQTKAKSFKIKAPLFQKCFIYMHKPSK